jgi:Fuc2NAc and GlcNAc transferase
MAPGTQPAELANLIIRIKDREKLTEAHRRHLYQVLANQAGLSHKKITFIYGAIQILIIILAWILKEKEIIYLISLLTVLSVICSIIGFRVRHRWEGSKRAA